MWSYETIIGCGMVFLGLLVLVLASLVKLNTVIAPRRDLEKKTKNRPLSNPPWQLTRKW